MKNRLKNWFERQQKEIDEADLKTDINKILVSVSKLPYKNQLEVMEKIKKSLETTKKAFEDEASEIYECLIKINQL